MPRVEISADGTCYRAGNLIIRHANHADDKTLQQILRDNPMQGWIKLALERSPSYFAGENLLGRSRPIIGQDSANSGAVIGMYHNAFFPVFVNGVLVQAGYLGELRINRAYRNRLRILKHGFAAMRPLNRPESDRAKIWFTSIASDNLRARRLLEAGHQALPRYTPVGELQTMAISVRHGKPPELLRQAAHTDIPAICDFVNHQAARYHFAPYLDPDWLLHSAESKGLSIRDFWLFEADGNIQACIAIWDQRLFKQAVVQGYRFPLNHLRPAYNILAGLQGKPVLPKPGRRLESVYLAFFAYKQNAEKQATNLIREALSIAAGKQAKIALLGLSANHPLLPELTDIFHPTIYQTRIETVNWPDGNSMKLTGLHVQPEIAIL